MTGGPPGTLYPMSTSGWMEAPNFLEWFTKLFFPAVEEMVQTGPVVLFLDGHQSHAALPLIELAKDHGVILYALPPHTTHLLQPLDVGVFAPLKQVWSQVLKKYKMETIGTKVTKEVFPSLVAKMWPQVLLPEHLISGFRAAGLHPLKRNTDESKLKISVPFQLPTSQLQSLEGTASSPPSQSQSRQSLEGNASSLPSQSQSQQSLLAENPVTVASPLPPQNQPPKTPVTLQIAKYFGNIFIQNSKVTVRQRGDRVEPRHYGEALTEDAVITILRQRSEEKEEKARQIAEKKKERARQVAERKDERERKQKERLEERMRKQAEKQERARQQAVKREERAKQKAMKKAATTARKQRRQGRTTEQENENICQGCNGLYEDDDEDSQAGWIGCDERGCWRWYHYWCAGELDVPDPKLRWICPACKEEDEV